MGRFIDLTGQKFYKLTVIKRAEDYITPKGRHYVQWMCKCDCGNEAIVLGDNLKKGHSKSCGCHNIEMIIARSKKYNTYNLTGEYGIGYTSKGEEFYFDLEDYDLIKDYCWCINNDGYVVTYPSNSKKILTLHRLIMGLPSLREVPNIDHKNKDAKYDNRKSNLRIATYSQNNMNKGVRSDNTSGVTGVRWSERDKKWYVEISANKERHRKSFADFEDAIKQRKEWEEEFFGEFSYDNSTRDVNGRQAI